VVARHLADPGGELTQTEAQRLIQVESGLMVLQAHLGETIRSQQRAQEVVLYVLGATIIAIIGIFWLVERESSIHRVAAARVKSFAQTAIGTQEQERARLARALHDTLAQELSVMLLQLEEQPFSDERRMQFKNRLLDSVAWLRNLSYELHPAEISQVGLGCAMKSYCEETGNRRHADIECEIEEPLAPLAESVAINIYRIGQEAVTNALKHARASRILLTLCEKNGQIELVVEDDGLGFRPADVARRREGLGLIGMRERATIAGGTLQIQSAEGEGTRIVFIASRGAGSGRREGEWNGSTYRSARG
jgi:signal transduction histidine kinase